MVQRCTDFYQMFIRKTDLNLAQINARYTYLFIFVSKKFAFRVKDTPISTFAVRAYFKNNLLRIILTGDEALNHH